MTLIEKQIQKTQHRLWMNRGLRLWGWWLTGAGSTWILLWIVVRLFALRWPMGWAALYGLGLSVVGAIAHLMATREPREQAATALDAAAGLKERVSTGLHVWSHSDDPFAQAVVADAQQAVAGLSARVFIPIRWPGSMSVSMLIVVAALLSLLLPEFDLLGKKQTRAAEEARLAELNRVRSAVARPVSAIQKMAEKTADSNLEKELKALEDAMKRETDPNVVRRETAKQLDRLEDALKAKAESDRFKALNETKKRLKQIGQPEDPKGELNMLMESLAKGDFKEAQDQIKKAQEQLAKHARDPKADPQKIEQMKKQLQELSNKINKAAEDKQSQRDLKNTGMSEKDIQRVLDTLSKKDPEQLQKLAKEMADRLKDKGVTKEQMEKLLNKIQQRQDAEKQMKGMAEKMNKASEKMQQGDQEGAKDELGQAGQMLSEMEQMEQSLNELESQMSELDKTRKDMGEEGDGQEPKDDLKCQKCGGSGFQKDGSPCPHCQGTGQGSGRGRGSGPRERDDSKDFEFANKKEKTQQNKSGTVIGQEYVKSKQLKNASQAELYDAAKAAEIDATDSLDKERIPRAYRKGVRTYFDRLGDQFKSGTKPASSQPAGT